MREPPEYREFLSRKITCTSCHWSDLGAYARTGEPVKWGIEKFCPQCGEFVAHAPWPTTEEPAADVPAPQPSLLRAIG